MAGTGQGVGRWRRYGFDAEDWRDVRYILDSLVPKAQIKVTERKEIVLGPMLAEEALLTEQVNHG
jgi:hypothetical protein